MDWETQRDKVIGNKFNNQVILTPK
jgi:hypothetical protein